MTGAVDMSDVLGARYRVNGDDPKSGVDCAWVVAEVWRRAGILGLDEIFALRMKFLGGNRIEEFFSVMERRFERVGYCSKQATEVGDIIQSIPPRGKFPNHLSTIVDAKERLAATTSERRGVVIVRVYAIQNVVAVWRNRGGDDL
jgi:hypothetical protein